LTIKLWHKPCEQFFLQSSKTSCFKKLAIFLGRSKSRGLARKGLGSIFFEKEIDFLHVQLSQKKVFFLP